MEKALCSFEAAEKFYDGANDFQTEFDEFRRQFAGIVENAINGMERKYSFYCKLKEETARYVRTAQEMRAHSQSRANALSAVKSGLESGGEKGQSDASAEAAAISAEINRENANAARYFSVIDELCEKESDLGRKADYLSTDIAEMRKYLEECERLFSKIESDNDRALTALTRVMRVLEKYLSLKIE